MAAHPQGRIAGRAPRSVRRLLGLDRSGPPPPETRPGQPLNPWTIPNAIGLARISLIPVALVLAFRSGDGRIASATILFAIAGFSDYLDGLAARLTGQYSRLGTLLDPLTDRLVVIAGATVAWRFELLPRWALGVLAAREVLMVLAANVALRRGVDLRINQLGRWALLPTMLSLFVAGIWVTWVAPVLLYVGLAMTLAATALYIRDGAAALRPSTSA